MAMEYKDLVKLAKIAVSADASSPVAYSFGDEKFTCEEVNDALRRELNELAGTYALYRENKNKIFSLIEESFNDVLPQKVMSQYGQFAEIKQFAQGDRPVFTQRITTASRERAKKFVTKVGLAGIYEVFKLDGRNYEVQTNAIGGACQIALEEFLDGRVQMSDYLDIVMEAMDETIYVEIAKALASAVNNLAPYRQVKQNGFDQDKMDALLAISDAYGKSTIYCTFEFAAEMIPDSNWISNDMKDRMWADGRLGNYKGHNVVILPQSFEVSADGKKAIKVIDPSVAYIIPTGAEKPVKVAFEGNLIVDEFKNYDRSTEIQMYRKVGVAVITDANLSVYTNSNLKKEYFADN